MKKIKIRSSIIIGICLVVVVLAVTLFYGSRESETEDGPDRTGHFGDENAPFHLVVLIPSEAGYYSREIKRVQDVLGVILSQQLDNRTLYIRTVPEPETAEQREHYFNVLKSSEYQSILLSPFEGIYSHYVRELAAENEIPYLFFSQEESSVCGEKGMSPYLWNFGVTTSMYVEPYLTSLNQQFAKLASDVSFFFYLNENDKSVERVQLFRRLIDELGFRFSGAVSVDDRFTDLYTTIRAIFGKVPDVVIGFMTPRGRNNFFPQASKLALNLEMGVSLEYGIEEEELRQFGKDAEGVILPVTYVADYSSGQNEIFKEQLRIVTGEESPTMASYKGFIYGKILEMVFSRIFTEEYNRMSLTEKNSAFVESLASLDQSRIIGPSGTIMIHSSVQGLIQPLHIAEFRDGNLRHSRYIGDITQSLKLCQSPADY